MPDLRELVYWDANVFLSYINADPARLPILDALLDMSGSEKGQIQIVTSALSVVEVAFALQEKEQKVLDPQVERKIDSLWADEQAVKIAEFHELTSRDARKLMRFAIPNGWSLKAADAIHLSTAEQLGVAEFHTYDSGLFKYAALVGFPIVEPRVGQPRLFDSPGL